MDFKSQVSLADIIHHINKQPSNQTWIRNYPMYLIEFQLRNYTHFILVPTHSEHLLNIFNTRPT